MPSPRLATPSTLLLPAPLAQGLPRGAWHYQWSFFDPQRGAWRAARVETHQAALAAAPAAPAAAAAAAAAALVIMVLRVARPILVIEGHGTLRNAHAVGCAARRAGSEGRVHVHLEIRGGHRVATAAATAIAAIAAIAAAVAVTAAVAAVGAEAEASVERGLRRRGEGRAPRRGVRGERRTARRVGCGARARRGGRGAARAVAPRAVLAPRAA